MLLLCLLTMGGQARGGQLESETDNGYGSLIEDLTLDTKNDKLKNESQFSFNAAFNINSAPQNYLGANTNLNTYDLKANLDWLSAARWELEGGFEGSWIPMPNPLTGLFRNNPVLHTIGPVATLAYTFEFGEKPEKGSSGATPKEDDPFIPSLEIKATGEFLYYSAEIPKGFVYLSGVAQDVTLLQVFPLLQLTYEPWDWLTAKASFTYYFYNRNAADYVSAITNLSGSNRVPVKMVMGGLSNVASGLPLDLTDLELDFFPMDGWEWDFEATVTASASDGTLAQGYETLLTKDWGDHFRTGIGAEANYSWILTEYLLRVKLTYIWD